MHVSAARARLGAGHRAKILFRFQGTKRRKFLQENIGVLDVDLSSDDLARIEEVAPKDAFAGSRYPKAMPDLLNR
jgi:diketogulonate reductase-like aldo/keto reductase